ncbi:hypothetical protein [Streptomyces hiroshimensis]|uniref:DUF3168 domain-containing protein n=1 Tax=Streptomyces hiroshimensis TaxID=66424 RepID=A0ABQ2Y600_9ACTN|nr:hypothetical protein [Streptomyces hiroshimensis]GGX63208.1 hypothetical protein GCM10010324_04950 [Streptomyces hiroshimensis]
MTWPDAEAALVAWLTPRLGLRVCTDTPVALETALPLVRLRRIGGTDDGFRLDRALIDVDAFATDRAGAAALAGRVRDVVLTNLPSASTRGAVFTAAATVTAPCWRPWDNPAASRFGAVYAIHLHAAP